MAQVPRSHLQRAEHALSQAEDLLSGGERRDGQHEMLEIVVNAIDRDRHAIVAAGTGTGKSLAYLLGAVTANKRTVIATATKALQDQLADSDLPLVARSVGRDISWTVLKGRSNYLCLQRLSEAASSTQQQLIEIEPAAGRSEGSPITPRWVETFQDWSRTTSTGDRAELQEEPPGWVWSAVSVGPRECPGANKCPEGDTCFAERARRQAASADVIIVNTHLYALHLKSDLGVLPHHDVVIFDEAHEVEDIVATSIGIDLGASTFTALSRLCGSLIADDSLVGGVDTSAAMLNAELLAHHQRRFRKELPHSLVDTLGAARQRLMDLSAAASAIPESNPETATRKARVLTNLGALVLDIDTLLSPPHDSVMWVDGLADSPVLNLAPLDVGASLDSLLWNRPSTGLTIETERDQGDQSDQSGAPTTAIFTSATIPSGLAERMGLDPEEVEIRDVGTPFDFAHQALLYCAAHLPEPKAESFAEAMYDELEQLLTAAGGRTLSLYTSHRAMNAAAEALRERVDTPILVQGDLPKPKLIETFASDESTSLFATMGYWAGIDVPGRSLTLVTIDKIPFPRPDEPLHQARRERAGASGFTTIDLPRAATLLAQGVGRLIRTSSDQGVVAIFDKRLATAVSYRWHLVSALPPMARTKNLADALERLGELTNEA